MSKRYNAKPLILSSFFAALTGIASMISIPLPFSPVPVNLALLSVYLAGGLLGAKNGAISQIIYILMGAVGLPVFHNLTGGLAVLTGPTGGYIIGYVLAAYLVGFFYSFINNRSSKKNYSNPMCNLKSMGLTVGILIGLTTCYTLGTLWFIYLTDSTIPSALLLCVIPFLPGDALKIIAALFLIKKLCPIIGKIG